MPLNRHLFYRNTEHLCEEQNFDVEDPGCQMLAREDLVRSFSGEKLESTLSVADVTNTEHTKDCVETIHQKITEERAL